MSNVFNNGQVYVMPDKCGTCIFRPGNKMTLQPGRVKGMVDSCLEDGGAIPCHKTTYGQRDQQAVCRGFFDSYKDQVAGLRMAERLGLVVEVEGSE